MLLLSRVRTAVRHRLSRIIRWATASKLRLTLCVIASVAVLTSGGALAYMSFTTPAAQPDTTSTPVDMPPAQQPDTPDAAAPTPSEDTDTAAAQSAPAKSTTTKPSSSPKAKAMLIIDKQSVSIKAGQSATITVRSSDGRAINSPLMTQNIGVQLNTGFGAARPAWTVTINAMQNVSKSGTYTLKLGAQDASAAFLYGSLTVTIGSIADFTMYANPHPSDPANPVKYYQVYVTPSGGFAGVVEIIGTVSGAPCGGTSGAVANSPFDLYCTVPSAAPHGTITITVRAMYEPITRTTTVSY